MQFALWTNFSVNLEGTMQDEEEDKIVLDPTTLSNSSNIWKSRSRNQFLIKCASTHEI